MTTLSMGAQGINY